MEWPALRQWWTISSLYQAAAPATTRERTYAWSPSGPANADPRTDAAAVTSLFETPAATVETKNALEIVLAGGYSLSHLSAAAAKDFVPPKEAQRVDIGRGEAYEWWIRVTPAQRLRVTRWSENGAELLVLTCVERHTPADVRAFASGLRPAA